MNSRDKKARINVFIYLVYFKASPPVSYHIQMFHQLIFSELNSDAITKQSYFKNMNLYCELIMRFSLSGIKEQHQLQTHNEEL